MKKLIALALASFFTTANAAEVSEAMANYEMCDGLGQWAAKTYIMKQEGMPKPQYVKPGEDPYYRPLFLFMQEYSWNEAADARQAYTVVYGKCMDNIHWIALDRNARVKPATELRY